ncbi:hypothetical protein CFE70_005913 [Pyrenophora teres f. teres 0-1]|uniref:HTH APSES-type domain-containing protein n=1 Tax=Pyrenophora teres f. teres (strain 0-1) TaxID=861557 RepID=E3RS77_PYRTT|nr:hypothetical protein PTT_11729 [Pyrenophora teres f. teres 0-1]KAE8847244.1 hypothetical protein HRS9122_04151 [Pyrenophora teres f. teres]KAE8866296.1 hypothetical protein PTNB29_03443 [Pyrenophora teres f. teres]KAK1919862.1 hypothetical protein P3342_002155 [Pyrenophora teres f. teres]
MKISHLLNPFCGDRHNQRESKSPTPASHPVATVPAPKRQKIPKDAPIFSDGNRTVGTVNFAPYENQHDQELLAQHRKFQIYPLGEIFKKGVRHIPYNSEKKDFLEKTGRDAFEMFQYTYKRPGEDKEYVVVWDYNVGLVRMTPFFKSCKYSKTIPAKALRENPGLKEISYSITGGALVCQGYWMPYHAARAIAATFCYDIRWALTPVFGDDFPSICLTPNDPCFAKFLIDPAIVQYCAQETARFRELGPLYKVQGVEVPSQVETAKLRFGPPPLCMKVVKQRSVRPADIESGYGSDAEGRDRYLCSPEVSPRTRFTPINRPLSPYSPRTADSSIISSPVSLHIPQGRLTPTSAPSEYQYGGFRTKRTHSKVNFYDHVINEAATRPQTAKTVDSAHGSEVSGSVDNLSYADMDAAEALLSLCGEDTMPPAKRTRRHGSTDIDD